MTAPQADPMGDPRDLLDALVAAGPVLARRPVRELVQALGEVGERFLDPDDPLTREAAAALPGEAGYSDEMARIVIRGMARDWTRERLGTLLLADFPDPGVLDGFRPSPTGGRLFAHGGRFAFHLGAGNVPGVGTTSLIRSLLVKCPLLLKPGRGDLALSRAFVRGLAELDPELGAAVTVVYWPRGEGGALEADALRRAERVVAYGGNEVVSGLRARLPSTTPLVAYAHRISLGAVAREALGSPEAATALARDAARAISTFDQRGCVSPQTLWVESGGRIPPREWAEALAREMDALARTMPPGPPDPALAAAIQQERGTAELRAAAGREDALFAGEGLSWTVLVESDPRGSPVSCGGRTIRLRPVEALEELPTLLEPLTASLQSLALAAPPERRTHLAGILARSGLSRITTFRELPWPPAWWRHDGTGPLQALVRWVELDD